MLSVMIKKLTIYGDDNVMVSNLIHMNPSILWKLLLTEKLYKLAC